MLDRVFVRVARFVAPEWANRRGVRSWYGRQAVSVQNRLSAASTLEEKVDLAVKGTAFNANQKPAEVLGLLSRIQSLPARRVCEIGAFEGGNLALLAQAATPDALLLSLDIDYTEHRLYSYPKLARRGQQITCLNADTHKPATVDLVRQWLGADLLDVLFIDGDHSYTGVKMDFEMYSPFVRVGGLIAFHDIHPDFKTRYGQPTENDVGEVPRFWTELASKYPNRVELIEDDAQDGYGIGIIQMG